MFLISLECSDIVFRMVKENEAVKYECNYRAQRPVTRSFDVFFDLRLNRRLSKQ